MPDGPPALSLRNVNKTFGVMRALADVDFEVGAGEIHGLVGENGSGKSTLVKIISGYHHPDAGAELAMWGDPVELPMRDPAGLGISIIHQDLALVESMSVVENLGITTSYGSKLVGSVSWSRLRAQASELIDRFGVRFDVDAMVKDLDPADRAALAIVRAMLQLDRSEAARGLLILDEPTAYLSGSESQRVAEVIRSVAVSGSSVIFISHHLREVLDLADRLTVLRDGRVVDRLSTDRLSERALIASMLGRELSEFYPDKISAGTGPVRLEVRDLTAAVVDGVSFDVCAGEILGVTGMVGMGQQELPYLLAGSRRPKSGTVRVTGEPLAPTPSGAIRQRVALVPANRQRDGVWPAATAAENMSLPVLGKFFRNGRLRTDDERAATAGLMRTFRVNPPDPTLLTSSFSGGNQQKVVLAKWLQTEPEVLLLDEPTQGVDAGARREILELVVERARQGAAVVVFSSDLEQLANICNRVLVMVRGRIAAEVMGSAVTEDELLHRCHAT